MNKYSVKKRKVKTQENKRGLTLSYSTQGTEYSIYHSEYGYVADIRDTVENPKLMGELIVTLLNSNKKYKLPQEV